jgi:hypothetical protein
MGVYRLVRVGHCHTGSGKRSHRGDSRDS